MTERYRLYRAGFNDRQIAETVGVDTRTIWGWRQRMGLACNKPEWKNRTEMYVHKRPAWERDIVRDCIGPLVGYCDKYKRLPVKGGVSKYFDEWRQKGGVA
jgi:hypothetical protein